MATIICDDKEFELPDDSPIRQICEELDVAFGCGSGYCGICQIEVEEGSENLNELSSSEVEMGMNGNTRFACQCRIKKGSVKIRV